MLLFFPEILKKGQVSKKERGGLCRNVLHLFLLSLLTFECPCPLGVQLSSQMPCAQQPDPR